MEQTTKSKQLMFKDLYDAGIHADFKLGKAKQIGSGSFVSVYFPWAYAYAEVMKRGDFTYKIMTRGDRIHGFIPTTYEEAEKMALTYHPQGIGYEVIVEVTWMGETHETRLPVTDSRHKVIENPSSSNINNSKQRCLAKAIAEATGFGLHMWSNDFETSTDKINPEQKVEEVVDLTTPLTQMETKSFLAGQKAGVIPKEIKPTDKVAREVLMGCLKK